LLSFLLISFSASVKDGVCFCCLSSAGNSEEVDNSKSSLVLFTFSGPFIVTFPSVAPSF
jgi:hypothetical protein